MDKEGSNRFFLIMLGFTLVGMLIVFLWNSVPALKNAVGVVLNPTAGALINWNLTVGSLAVFFVIVFISTIAQKYLTDQETLRELKQEQKDLHKEIQKYKEDPKKMMEMQKSVWPISVKIMQISMRGSMFTLIPILIFYRWFLDFFTSIGSPKILGMHWLLVYFLSFFIFSSILRKVMNVA